MGLISSRFVTPTMLERCCAGSLSSRAIGYTLLTADGRRIGVVKDLLFDDEAFEIRYLVVDTSTAEFPVGPPLVVLPATLCCEDAERKVVSSRATVEQVQAAPSYDPVTAISRAYEETVFTNFGERPYWPL